MDTNIDIIISKSKRKDENEKKIQRFPPFYSQEMYNSGLLLILLRNLHKIDFEGKKDAAQIFNNILRRQIGTRTPTVEYICTTPEILFTLCKGQYFMQKINFENFLGCISPPPPLLIDPYILG